MWTSDRRPEAVAGTFYPGRADDLARTIDDFMASARGREAASEPAPKAIVVPHAGYVFSGPIAASAFARVAPHADVIRRVILVGPLHRAYARGLVWPGAKALATPLGDVAVDGVALALVPEVRVDAHAHAAEHSLEVELPFIKRLLPRATVVPIGASVATAAEVGRTLLALYGGPETLIVISTDLSHYLPYGEAKRVDQETIQRVLTLDVDAVDHDRACGATGLTGLMWLAREKGLVPRVYDLRSSGDTAGDHRRVVGYAALGFYERATRSHEVPS